MLADIFQHYISGKFFIYQFYPLSIMILNKHFGFIFLIISKNPTMIILYFSLIFVYGDYIHFFDKSSTKKIGYYLFFYVISSL